MSGRATDRTGEPATRRVVLYGRTGCHLCTAAREVVAEVADAAGVGWVEVDVDGTAELAARYGELVPAVTVDGVLIDYWRIDAVRLAQVLA